MGSGALGALDAALSGAARPLPAWEAGGLRVALQLAEETRRYMRHVALRVPEDQGALVDRAMLSPGRARRKMRERLLRAMARAAAAPGEVAAKGASFRVAFMGDSVTAGHDEWGFQAVADQAHRELAGPLLAAGINASVVNMGMGGTRPFPNALCLDELLGPSVDVVGYQHDMTKNNAGVFTSWLTALAQHRARPLAIKFHPNWGLKGPRGHKETTDYAQWDEESDVAADAKLAASDYLYRGAPEEACRLEGWVLGANSDYVKDDFKPRMKFVEGPDGKTSKRLVGMDKGGHNFTSDYYQDDWVAYGWDEAAETLGTQELWVEEVSYPLVNHPGFHTWDRTTHGKAYAGRKKLFTCASCWHLTPDGARLFAFLFVDHVLGVFEEALAEFAKLRGSGQSAAAIADEYDARIESEAAAALEGLPPPFNKAAFQPFNKHNKHEKKKDDVVDDDGDQSFFYRGLLPTCRTAIEPQAAAPGTAASLMSIVTDQAAWRLGLPDSDNDAVKGALLKDRGYHDFKYGLIGDSNTGWLKLNVTAAPGGQQGPLVLCETFHGWGRTQREGFIAHDCIFRLDGQRMHAVPSPPAAKQLFYSEDPTQEDIDKKGYPDAWRHQNRRDALCAMVTESLPPGEHLLEVKVEKPGKTIIVATVLWWDRVESPNYATKRHPAHE